MEREIRQKLVNEIIENRKYYFDQIMIVGITEALKSTADKFEMSFGAMRQRINFSCSYKRYRAHVLEQEKKMETKR